LDGIFLSAYGTPERPEHTINQWRRASLKIFNSATLRGLICCIFHLRR